MRKLSFAIMSLGVIFALGSCDMTSKKIVVTNTLDIDRNGELTSVVLEGTEEKPVFTKGYMLLDENGEQLAYDVVRNQENPYSATILFQASVPAGGKATYSWERGKRNLKSLTPVVSAAVYFDRYNDFAWENDRIGFRAYHQYLIPIDGPSNGIDVLAKRTGEVVWPEFYKNGDYHKDHGKGLDFYKVGRSLGAGAMAPIFEGKPFLGENYDGSAVILEEGRLRVKFKLPYKPVKIGDNIVLEERTFTLEAGSQLNKVEVEYIGLPAGSEVAAGIVSRLEGCVGMAKSDYWAAYEDISDGENGNLFIGVLNPQKWDKVECLDNHILAYTKTDENLKVTYYQGAGWSKYGFPDFASWQQYLNDFQRKLENPLQATVR